MRIVLLFNLLLFSALTLAANQPCSKKNGGGINHCEGTKFICGDGSISKSTRDCMNYYNPIILYEDNSKPTPVHKLKRNLK